MSPDAVAAMDADSGASVLPPPREPWFSLLAAVTPSLYHDNPFRLLGLAALATPREITRRLDELKLALNLGGPAFPWAFARQPPPDGEELRDAAQVLKDAPQRVLREFFWFWPAAYPDADPDAALAAWFAGDAAQAVRQWKEGARAGQVVAVHNLAVYHHLTALEVERSGAELDETTTGWWSEALAEWTQLRASTEFWGRLQLRLERLADARVPSEFTDWMRSALPDALCGLHAGLAIGRAQRAQWHEATLHVQFARRVPDVHGRAEPMLERAVAQVVRGVELLVRETARQLAHDGAAGLVLTVSLLADAADGLAAVETICGHDSDFYRTVCTGVVDAALEGIIAYQRRTLDSCGVLPWLTHLTTLPASPEVRRRLEETADVLHANAIAEKIAPVAGGDAVTADSAAEFAAAYRLLVEEFIPGADRLDFGARAHADYLANVRRALRELAHAACHQLGDLDLAARALAAAVGISEGAERAALETEHGEMWAQLARRRIAETLLAETSAAAAAAAAIPAPAANPVPGEPTEAVFSVADAFFLNSGEHRLEISPEGIVFAGVALRAAELTGLRYGVRDAGGGDEAVRTYHIGWCTAATVVELDAANLLGPAAETERCYSLVLEALYAHIVPGLIARLVEWVRGGRAVPLGAAVLRHDGYVFGGRDFPWSGGVAVPYAQLAHALDTGELLVARADAPTEVEHYSLVEVWNAALGGHVIDALAAAADNRGDESP